MDNFSLRTTATLILIELFSLNQEQMLFLVNETDFFKYIISYYWEYLNDQYSREYNLKASHILTILHSILPNNLCEDLIYNQLSIINIQQDEIIIEEYKKFFKLWNSTREISNFKPEHFKKSFQNCLIYVLRILKESNNYDLKSIIQQSVYDSFIHGKTLKTSLLFTFIRNIFLGDVCRIFDTLLIMLLHSDTARVDLQRFDPNVHKEFFQDEPINVINVNDETTSSLIQEDDENEDIYYDEISEEENENNKRVSLFLIAIFNHRFIMIDSYD